MARVSILSAFAAGQGYSADADYSPRAWLINRTRITKGGKTSLKDCVLLCFSTIKL